MRFFTLLLAAGLIAPGCSALPDIAHEPQIHNPFPQLSRVAVLPFYNQSSEPTVDGVEVALAYFGELQAVPGFEVMPVGVAKRLLESSGWMPTSGEDYQRLAQFMGVDAVVVGSVTEFSPYYPPSLGLAVRWYAANPGFYPVPPGYGLPWGTSEEEFIPDSLVFEAEFALAKEQLKTQTPRRPHMATRLQGAPSVEALPPPEATNSTVSEHPEMLPGVIPEAIEVAVAAPLAAPHQFGPPAPDLPVDWPDPRGFVPRPPSPVSPALISQAEPVLSLTPLYRGNDAEFTKRLANYFYFRDDARFGDWQAYLQRSDDFIRFCCHLHLTELLSASGGAGKT
jgi:hypothetical protein